MENFNQPQSMSDGNQATVESAPVIPIVENKKPGQGALIGSIIVIVILLIGGLFLWSYLKTSLLMQSEETPQNTLAPSSSADTLSGSDDLSAIENEANATEIENTESADVNFDTQN